MSAERKELLLREARVEFDRYLRNFVAETQKRRSKGGRKTATDAQDDRIASFKERWAQYLVDE